MERPLFLMALLFLAACGEDPLQAHDAGAADAGVVDAGGSDAGPLPRRPLVVRVEGQPQHIEGRPWPSDHWHSEQGWSLPEVADDEGFFWVTTRQIVVREQGFALRPRARICFTGPLPHGAPPAGLVQILDAQEQQQAITQITVDRQRYCLGFSSAGPLLPQTQYLVVLRRLEGEWAAELAADAAPSENAHAQNVAAQDGVVLAEPFTVQALGRAVAQRRALLADGRAWNGQVPELEVLRSQDPAQIVPGSLFGREQGRRGMYVRLHMADFISPEEGLLTLAGEEVLDRNRAAATSAVVLKSVETGQVRFGLINGDWSVSAQIPAPPGSTVQLFQEIFVALQSFPELTGGATPAFGRIVFAQVPLPVWRGPDGLLAPLAQGEGAPFAAQMVQVSLWVPNGERPAQGWPLTVLGAGYAGLRHDMWILADALARSGRAAVAIDPVAHGGGPGTELQIPVLGGLPITLASPGRSKDVNGDARYGLAEGILASWAPPDFAGMTWLHDANRQTVLDMSALLTVLLPDVDRGRLGADLNNDGVADFDAADVAYVGHSNGGRYGMLFAAHEERLRRALLLCPPGDGYIPYISLFRPSWSVLFDTWQPSLTNTPSNRYGLFDEGIVWPDSELLDAPPDFQGINRYTVRRAWLAGDAEGEGAAHLWRLARAEDLRRAELMVQLVRGDPSVVNPDSMRLVDAAGQSAVLTVVNPEASDWRAVMRYSDLFFRHLIPLFEGRLGSAPADLGRLARAQMVAFVNDEAELDVDGDQEAIQIEPQRRDLRFLLGFDFWELRQLYRF